MTPHNFKNIAIAGLVVLLCLSFKGYETSNPKKMSSITNAQVNDSILRHVVLFKFKDSTTTKQLKTITDAFGELPSKIKEIKDFEWGLNNSPEGLEKGLTHCFLVTFSSEADREVYLPHPAHKAFVDLASPFIADVLVVDYWAD